MNESMISSKNVRRMRYRMSVQVESIIKITKNASTFHSLEKIECLAPWLSHMCKTGSHVTLRRHVAQGTVGGIKTVTFPFRSVPSKRNASSAVCRSITCTPPVHFRSVSVPFRSVWARPLAIGSTPRAC